MATAASTKYRGAGRGCGTPCGVAYLPLPAAFWCSRLSFSQALSLVCSALRLLCTTRLHQQSRNTQGSASLVWLLFIPLTHTAGVPHPGRRLLSDGYYSDATYTGQMAKVDTSFQSASYTTEAQRSQVAQYAQAAAVASGGSEPYLNVSPVSYDTTALLASYAAKVAAAKEAASTATSSPTTTASTASISSAQVMTQDDSSKQQQQASSPVLEISSWKSVLDKVKNTVNTATEEVANATSNASDAASNLLRISPATEASSPALQQASAADVHAPHHTGSSASITSTAGV